MAKPVKVWQASTPVDKNVPEVAPATNEVEVKILTVEPYPAAVPALPELRPASLVVEDPSRFIETNRQQVQEAQDKLRTQVSSSLSNSAPSPVPQMQCGHPYQSRGTDENGMVICKWCADIERLKAANRRLQTELEEKSVLVAAAVESSGASNRVIRQARVDAWQECLKVLAEVATVPHAVHIIRQKIQNEINQQL